MNPGAKPWMRSNPELCVILPPPGEVWQIGDIRREDGTPRNGQGYTSHGLVTRVERPGYGKSNYYETCEDAFEFIQTELAGQTPEVDA